MSISFLSVGSKLVPKMRRARLSSSRLSLWILAATLVGSSFTTTNYWGVVRSSLSSSLRALGVSLLTIV
jgi:hypothetical protein